MNDNAKIAVVLGTGLILGKATGSSSAYWWMLAGAGALFLMNSPNSRKAISSGARSAYSEFKART